MMLVTNHLKPGLHTDRWILRTPTRKQSAGKLNLTYMDFPREKTEQKHCHISGKRLQLQGIGWRTTGQ